MSSPPAASATGTQAPQMGLMCSQPVQGSVPMGNIQLNPAMLPAGMGGAAMNGQPTIIVLAPFGLPAPAAWRAGPTASSPPPPPSSAPASKRAHATIQELITAAVRSKGRAKLREIYDLCKADGRIVCKRTGDVRLITDNTHWKSQVRHTLYTGNDKFRRCEDDPDYWETVPAHGEAREQQAMAPGLQALVAASALAQQDAAAAAGISVKEESCSLDTGPQGPQAQQQQQLQSHGRTSQGREASSSDTTSAVAPLPVEASSMSAAAAAAAQTTGGEDSSAERGQAAAPGPSSTATGGRQRPRKALRAKPIIEKQRRSPARPSTGRALRGRGTPEPAQAAATQQQQQAVMQALQMQVQPMVMPFMQAAGGGAGGSAAAGQLPPLAALAAMLQQYGLSIVPTASLTGAAAAAAAAAGAGTSTGGGQGGVHSPSAAAGAPLQPGAQVPAAGMVQAPPSVAQLQVGSIQMFAPQVGSAGGGMDAHAAMQMVAALMGGTAARPATPT